MRVLRSLWGENEGAVLALTLGRTGRDSKSPFLSSADLGTQAGSLFGAYTLAEMDSATLTTYPRGLGEAWIRGMWDVQGLRRSSWETVDGAPRGSALNKAGVWETSEQSLPNLRAEGTLPRTSPDAHFTDGETEAQVTQAWQPFSPRAPPFPSRLFPLSSILDLLGPWAVESWPQGRVTLSILLPVTVGTAHLSGPETPHLPTGISLRCCLLSVQWSPGCLWGMSAGL